MAASFHGSNYYASNYYASRYYGPSAVAVVCPSPDRNDKQFCNLRALGYTGTLPDMKLQHLKAELGVTKGCLPDLAVRRNGSMKAYNDSLL